jgi:hypothetical protein
MILETIARKTEHVSYLYKNQGWIGVARQITKKIISPFYQKEVQYVWLRDPKRANSTVSPSSGAQGDETECIVLESLELFEHLRNQIPLPLATRLETRLKEGCILFIAWRRPQDGLPRQLVGYSITQGGIFSALGRSCKVTSSILFTHYSEVLPGFRGQRVVGTLWDARDLYCRRNGYKKHCGVVSTDNLPSIRSLRRLGARIVGTTQRVRTVGANLRWEPSWEEIFEMIGDQSSCSPPTTDSMK